MGIRTVATAAVNTNITGSGIAADAIPDPIKPGAIAYFSMSAAPEGWIKANGATISRTVYANLFAAIGTTYGAGDGSTTFKLPDLRGEFVRGVDDGRGVDTGRVIGSVQDYATAVPKTTTPSAITASGTTTLVAATNPSKVGFARVSKTGEPVTAAGTTISAGSQIDAYNVATGDTETRPRNVAMLACIKF